MITRKGLLAGGVASLRCANSAMTCMQSSRSAQRDSGVAVHGLSQAKRYAHGCPGLIGGAHDGLCMLYASKQSRCTWMVLPKPISSARMPLKPCARSELIHARPCNQQVLNLASAAPGERLARGRMRACS